MTPKIRERTPSKPLSSQPLNKIKQRYRIYLYVFLCPWLHVNKFLRKKIVEKNVLNAPCYRKTGSSFLILMNYTYVRMSYWLSRFVKMWWWYFQMYVIDECLSFFFFFFFIFVILSFICGIYCSRHTYVLFLLSRNLWKKITKE